MEQIFRVVLTTSIYTSIVGICIIVLESINTPRLAPKLICMVVGKKNTERRIKMIKMSEFFKRRNRLIIVTSVLCMVFLGGILLTSGIAKENTKNLDGTLVALLKYKTAYVGNNSKVVHLVNNLNYAEFKGVTSLETKKRPYGVTVNYDMRLVNIASGQVYKALRYNAIMMFSLIDNVDVIHFNVEGSLVTNYEFKRENIQKSFLRDVREYSKNIDTLKILNNSINFTIYESPKKYSLDLGALVL